MQCDDQSWTGKELTGLAACLAKESDRPVTLSLSLIFEHDENDGTVRT